jgi:hypothetical protein
MHLTTSQQGLFRQDIVFGIRVEGEQEQWHHGGCERNFRRPSTQDRSLGRYIQSCIVLRPMCHVMFIYVCLQV